MNHWQNFYHDASAEELDWAILDNLYLRLKQAGILTPLRQAE